MVESRFEVVADLTGMDNLFAGRPGLSYRVSVLFFLADDVCMAWGGGVSGGGGHPRRIAHL